MSDQTSISNDAVDLYGIIDFLLLGRKTIVAMALAGGVVGLVAAFALPVKFEASGSIDGGKVIRAEIEPIAVVADRMRSSSFYSEATLVACDDGTSVDPAIAVSKMIDPKIPRNSYFIAVKARMESIEAARNCLESVLRDVRASQAGSFQLLLATAESQLSELKTELARLETVRKEELGLYEHQLLVVQEKLTEAEQFVQTFQLNVGNLDIGDEKFSASSLVVSMVSAKEREVLDLRGRVLELESLIRSKSGQPGTESAIANLKLKILDLEGQLKPPSTQEAIFSAPIFAQRNKVEPKRSLIAAGGILAGGFAGLMIMLFRRFLAEYKIRRRPA